MSRQRRKARNSAGGGTSARPRAVQFDSSWLRQALVLLVALKIAGLILIFDPASAQAFDGPKSTFSRATAWLLLAVIGLAVLRFGHGSLARTRLHVIVGAFVLANVLAAAFAQDPYTALFGGQRHLGLSFVLDMSVLYVAVALAYRTRSDWAILAGAVGAAGLAAMTYAIVQYTGLDPIAWADDVRSRPPSTFGNPDKFGHFLGASFAAALALAVLPLAVGGARRLRLLALLYAVAALGIAALVATRGTLLGIAVALVASGAVYVRLSRVRPGSRGLLAIAGAGAGLVIVAVALVVATPLGERVRGGFADLGTQQRVLVADASIRALRDRPLAGHGPDGFGVIYPRYRQPGSVAAGGLVNQDSAHNWLLQAAATTGALGALSLAAVAFATFLLLWRGVLASPYFAAPVLAGVVAYWAHGLVTIGSVSVDWMGWLAAGGAATLGSRPAVARTRRLAPVLQAIAIGAALVLAISGYSALQANRELNVARAARQVSRPERAIPAAERAIRLDSGRAEHWFALGLAQQDRGAWRDAADAFRAATDRAPLVSAYWSNLAVSLTNLARAGDRSLGGKEAALAAARRGAEADPYYPTPHHVLAVVANALGDHADALEASAVAIRLYKGEAEYEAVAADAALRMVDGAAARSALERLVEEKDAPVLRVALARISLKLNDPQAARAHVRRALELDPQNVPAREMAGQLGI